MDWVVTYKIEDVTCSCLGILEFFRGSEEECRRISQHFVCGESDFIKTRSWDVFIGPAEDWDQLLATSIDI